jgi:hypothetical protein
MSDRVVRILNLGAGRQSSYLYLKDVDGELFPAGVHFDAAIFADTQDEPKWVYSHLEWLKSLGGPPILTGTVGRLGDDLIAGRNVAGKQRAHGRFSSIPAFTAADHVERGGRAATSKEIGRVPRQCTKDYKIELVERMIRRLVLGLAPRKRIPRGVFVEQYFGISYDERSRTCGIKRRFDGKRRRVGRPVFPLVDQKLWVEECQAFLAERVPHPVGRSACVFCPYRKYSEWARLKADDPEGFARAVEIDRAIRDPTSAASQGMRQSLYLARSALPLGEIDLEAAAKAEAEKDAGKKTADLFTVFECDEGMCGV